MRPFIFRNKLLFICFFVLFANLTARAQVTTSTVGGVVSDNEGKPLSGATVTVAFPDAGIKRIIITQSSGNFLVPNLRVGGPYSVTVSFTGYKPKTESNIFLELGQTSTIDFKLEPSAANLNEVTVRAKSRLFNENRTGPSTNISSAQVRQLTMAFPLPDVTGNTIIIPSTGQYSITPLAWMRRHRADRPGPSPFPWTPSTRSR
jgi:hypothetical protein